MPVEVIYEDQIKPEVGVQKTQKLIESDRSTSWSATSVERGVGFAEALVDSKTITSSPSGASQIAGELCSLRVTTSWNNDQTHRRSALHEPEGREDGVPDRPELRRRQGMLEGVASTFKGQIRRPELTRAEPARLLRRASKARAAKPTRFFAFLSGGAASSSLRQYAQSGMKGQIRCTTLHIDELSIPRLKDLAVGIRARRSG